MNYLEYGRPDDRSEEKRIRDKIEEHRQVLHTRILGAKEHRARGNNVGVENGVRLARHESRQAQRLLRSLREMAQS